jgi:O-antigen ligase
MKLPALIVLVIAFGTLAFGGVYAWAFLPLFAAAAAIGLVGLRRGVPKQLHPLGLALALVCAAVAAQLMPLPPAVRTLISPHEASILMRYRLGFGADASKWVPLSVNPRATEISLLAAVALSLYFLGLPRMLDSRAVRSLPPRLAALAVLLAFLGIYFREHSNGLMYGFFKPNRGGSDQFGPFVNRNHFGGWMVMTVTLVIGALCGQIESAKGPASGRRRHRLEWLSSGEPTGIVMVAGAVLICMVALVWCLSRSALLGFGFATLMFMWLLAGRQRLSTGRRLALLSVIGGVLLAGMARRGPRVIATFFTDPRDLFSRFEAWRDGWALVRDFPWTGTGMNTYPTAMLFYQKSNQGAFVAQAHNDYLQLLAEGGLLVAVPALLAIVLLVLAIRRNLRAARIAVQEMFEFSLQIPANALLFSTLAALALTPVRTAVEHRRA